MKKTCVNCGKVYSGIARQKYCSASCKNQYNYNRVKKETQYTKKVDDILHKNRSILKNLLGSKKSTIIFRINILALGYCVEFHTNIQKMNDGKMAYLCYEYGIKEIDNERFRVFKNKELIQ